MALGVRKRAKMLVMKTFLQCDIMKITLWRAIMKTTLHGHIMKTTLQHANMNTTLHHDIMKLLYTVT